ncbi:MAG: hypothetical protein JW967_10385 [Dehalococcoidales bacterium]|nr:hypothetical protein [Dehalococcoidales bacterium]
MVDEYDKYKILLSHMVEHETEHVSEFYEIAEKVKELGSVEAQKAILDGIKHINNAVENFQKALKIVKEENL